MGANSSIQWTTHTFNPWIGCQRVSPGCQNCYAESYDKRVGGVLVDGVKTLRWGPKAPRVRTSPANWKKPLQWNRAAEAAGERHRVFCSSLADVFEDRPELVPWRAELFDLIARTPHLDWLLLTKRPENIARLMSPSVVGAWPNVWLGTTVEDQQRADERIPALLEVPAVVRFLSCEPLLERVDLSRWLGPSGGVPGHCVSIDGEWWHEPGACKGAVLNCSGRCCTRGIDWVIIGGESGPGARPFHIEWARDLVAQCRAADVAPFVKQLGARPMRDDTVEIVDYEQRQWRPLVEQRLVPLVDPAGGDINEWPDDLQVREFPEVNRG